MMDIIGLNLVLNHNCNIECVHCFYNSTPEMKSSMDLDDLREYVQAAYDNNNKLRWVGLGCGGEVFLEFEKMIKALEIITEITDTTPYVMTNAYWATSKEVALEKLSRVKEAGAGILWFSLDSFHQKFVPMDRVVNAVKAALELEFDEVSVTSVYLDNIDTRNSYNDQTRALMEKFKEELADQFDQINFDTGGDIIPGGRASDLYFRYLEDQVEKGKSYGVPDRRCKGTTFWGKNIKSPYGLEMFPDGTVGLCTGISIGNAKETPLKEIIENWNYKSNPIVAAIGKQGPAGLIPLAEERGYVLKDDYYNECHLCYDLRKFLQPYFPEFLSAKLCYT